MPALGFPAVVTAVEDLDMPEGKPSEFHTDPDSLQFYGCKISTDRGEIVIDYRNDSNGYYGGNLFKQGTELVAIQRGNLEMGNIAPQDISKQITAWSILTAAYHMLKNGTLYEDLGADHFDNRAKGKQVLRLVSRLQNLGFTVSLTPTEAAA